MPDLRHTIILGGVYRLPALKGGEAVNASIYALQRTADDLLPRLEAAELACGSAALPPNDPDNLDLPAFLRNRRPH